MKRVFFSLLILFVGLYSNGQKVHEQVSGKMDLLSPFFCFENDVPVSGVLNRNIPSGSFTVSGGPKKGFSVQFTIDIKKFENKQPVLVIPGILTVHLLMADPEQPYEQNYRAFKMEDGSLPVLEARILLHSQVEKPFRQEMRIGFPIAMLANPMGKHTVVLNFSGPKFTMYVDNEIRDNDFPIGYPKWSGKNEWKINPDYVEQAKIFSPALNTKIDSTRNDTAMPDVLFWTPSGHNSWVGDVATIYFKGRYHVFYLFDRRHHRSKFGVGGHYFEHFSTTDFKTWTEHEAAVPIDEQWETIGTGTPFVYHDRLYLSYGLHTSRIYPDSLTMSPRQIEYNNQNKKTGDFHFDLREAFPSGATYAVSQDNLSKFKKSGVLFHFCENPSVYITSDGKLKMLANFRSKGTWESESLDSGWRCINPEFPLGGDCTFNFRWGGYEYVIGGFVNLWKRPVDSPGKRWEDMVAEGKDFYNGINVPSISRINNGRYLMAGWIPINGWGGTFVAHELIQYPDGHIGTKWMKELIPNPRDTALLSKRIEEEASFKVKDSSFILSFDVYPKKKKSGNIAISFLSSSEDKDEKSCDVQLNLGELTAQYSHATEGFFSAPEKSLRQGGSPQSVRNYAIENLMGVNKPFSLRILVKNNSKLGGSIFDSEIAGQNTMISYSEGLTITNIVFKLKEVDIRNVRLMKIGN